MAKIISTDKAPAAIGPYSQAIVVGNIVYTSGQIPIVPESGLIETTSVTDQTEQVMKNLAAVLEAAGSSFEKAIKTKIHVAEDPFHTAVKGAMIALEKPSILENTDYLYRSIQELKIDYSE